MKRESLHLQIFESAWQTFRREMKAVEPSYSVNVFLLFSLPSANERSEEILGLGRKCSENWRNNFFYSKFAHWIFNFFFIQIFSALSVCWKFSSSLAHQKNNRRQEKYAIWDSSKSGASWVLVGKYWSRSVLEISLITPLRTSQVA